MRVDYTIKEIRNQSTTTGPLLYQVTATGKGTLAECEAYLKSLTSRKVKK